MRPIIGVTSQPKQAISASGSLDSHVIGHTYTDSVLRAGGIPVILPPIANEDVPTLVDRLDGIVFTGGGDMDPGRYGEESHPEVRKVNPARDEFEILLVHEAKERRLPVLAICRGLQVVTVALGGTLIQDIPSVIGSTDHGVIGDAVYEAHQPVTIDANSGIAKAVGETEIMVNSIHHQAVKDLAPGFRAVAWAGDGVIEGIQHEDDEWPLLAVQWHPEFLGDNCDETSHRLFEAFIESILLSDPETDWKPHEATIGC
ncbi:MAG: gamma-glutamyl-gamma-aminobutyrate hydrolase family protein [Actinomycetota bacterium]|nr:gamma-glutamyl-gamma-aminobutyrate hydrolase family protein [Actinomycetota bacterium]